MTLASIVKEAWKTLTEHGFITEKEYFDAISKKCFGDCGGSDATEPDRASNHHVSFD